MAVHNCNGSVPSFFLGIREKTRLHVPRPGSHLSVAETRREYTDFVHAAKHTAVAFCRGGPFVSGYPAAGDSGFTALRHSLQGVALDPDAMGATLSDIAVRLGALPPGQPVQYPDACGAPALFLCSYLGGELTRMWVEHTMSLAGTAAIEVREMATQMLTAEFTSMLQSAAARTRASVVYKKQDEWRKTRPHWAYTAPPPALAPTPKTIARRMRNSGLGTDGEYQNNSLQARNRLPEKLEAQALRARLSDGAKARWDARVAHRLEQQGALY
jgi:hypothetical protein